MVEPIHAIIRGIITQKDVRGSPGQLVRMMNFPKFFSNNGGIIRLFASLLSMEEGSGLRPPDGGSSPASGLSFEQLYDLYATDVLRVSYYYLGNREMAEDVTQDVFVKLLTNQPSLEEGREKAWLLKVALNRCRDLWRSAWIKKVVLGHPGFECFPAPDEIGQLADQYSLSSAVNRLKPEFKEVVLLFYYQGFSVTEIADMLQIAEGTVSSRLSRAREKLQNELKGDVKH